MGVFKEYQAVYNSQGHNRLKVPFFSKEFNKATFNLTQGATRGA